MNAILAYYFLATWIILPVLFGTKVLGEGTPVRARAAAFVVVPVAELRRVETPTDAGGGGWEVTGVSKASVFEAEPALRVVVARAGGEANELVVFLAVVFLATVDLALGVSLLLAGAVALNDNGGLRRGGLGRGGLGRDGLGRSRLGVGLRLRIRFRYNSWTLLRRLG